MSQTIQTEARHSASATWEVPMTTLLSAADVALAFAMKAGTLRMVVRASRFGGEFYSLEDDVGVIEVADSHEEAVARLREIEGRLN